MSDRETHIARAFEQLECAGISKEAREVVEAVVDGRYSGAVNRPRIAGLFEAAKLYTVYVKLPEGTCDLCFGEGTLRDNKVCHRCKGTGNKSLPTFEDVKGIYADCPTCGGSGDILCQIEVNGSKTYGVCPTCEGSGEVPSPSSKCRGKRDEKVSCPTCGGSGEEPFGDIPYSHKFTQGKCPTCQGTCKEA